MATGVIYLDIDDEITSAAARIRDVDGRRVAVVLPYGSRVATSRINFRLLARDAMTHEKRLSIISGDAGTRALAASAGLPIFATVGEYESSLGTEGSIADPVPVADRPLERSETVVAPPDDDGAATMALGAAALGASAAGAAGGPVVAPRPPEASAAPLATSDRPPSRPPTQPVARSAGRGIGRGGVIAGVAVLALAVVIGGVAAYLLLPSATAVVTPREETIGPVALRISASTDIDEPDAEAGLVPAEIVTIDVEASDTFPATGTRVAQTRAKGTVRFHNLDPTSSNTIAKGALISTQSGIRFRTNAAVTVPAAELSGFTVLPATRSVGVTASEAGPDGNVGSNAIQNVPRGENSLFLQVTNPEPTTGGTREEFPRVTQEDVDNALIALDAQLMLEFTDRLEADDLVAGDVSVFPETAELGPSTPTGDPEDFVGEEVETFDLAATATGTVTTVDAGPVREIAEARLEASVEPGHVLVEGSSEITEAPAVVEGDTITYPVVATARQIAILVPADLQALILGKPVEEAEAILSGYGDALLEVWPDWVGTVPSMASRVEVTVDGPTGTPTASPGASPSSPPTSPTP